MEGMLPPLLTSVLISSQVGREDGTEVPWPGQQHPSCEGDPLRVSELPSSHIYRNYLLEAGVLLPALYPSWDNEAPSSL